MTPARWRRSPVCSKPRREKAGNVHRFRDFDDCPLPRFRPRARGDRARASTWLGRKVSVSPYWRRSRRPGGSRSTNTNLGMVLLLVPLATVPIGEPLRDGVADVLLSLTLEDARLVYQAIRLANPRSLGKVTNKTSRPTRL